jgi:hypothetical protein
MKVSPISNAHFQAKFKKTNTLERLLLTADKETLGRFNDVLKNAEKVKNDVVYKFSAQDFSDEFSPGITTTTFYLHKLCNGRLTLEKFIPKESLTPQNIEEKMNIYCGILKKFLPALEQEYPNEYKDSSEKIRKEIEKRLIKD